MVSGDGRRRIRTILHVDFNSYFATVEQQANPRLRGKPIGVTGGDRMPASPDERASRGGERTVIGAASVEAKKFGVKTGMQIWEAKKLCPQITIVPGDSDKYLETTKKFLNILKDYSPYLEVFSIDEVFLEIPTSVIPANAGIQLNNSANSLLDPRLRGDDILEIAKSIKKRIKTEIGEWITCSIGISYNKLLAKLAGSLQKPDGLVIIANQKEAIKVLDKLELDAVCGIGPGIKNRLNKLGIFNFKQLREATLDILIFYFKSYGQFLYDCSRGINHAPIFPFYEKEEVKSIGHRHTTSHDTNNLEEIKQLLLKLTELVARRLRAKKLVGRTVHCWFRYSFHLRGEEMQLHLGGVFHGDGMQVTIPYTCDGLEIFKATWKIFHTIWNGDKIRTVGVSISNLKSETPQNLSLLPESAVQEKIIQAIDQINNKYGEFTLQRGILLGTGEMKRKPNPFLADRRFKL